MRKKKFLELIIRGNIILKNYQIYFDEVYKSKNILMTDNKFYRDKEFKNKITHQICAEILKKQIKIKDKIKNYKFLKTNYLKEKILSSS